MNRKQFLAQTGMVGMGLLAKPALALGNFGKSHGNKPALKVLLPAGLAHGIPGFWNEVSGIWLPDLGSLKLIRRGRALGQPGESHTALWQKVLLGAGYHRSEVMASETMGLGADLGMLQALQNTPSASWPKVLVLGSSDLVHGSWVQYLEDQELVFSTLKRISLAAGLRTLHLYQLHGRDGFENGHGGFDHQSAAAYAKVWSAAFALA